MLDSIMTLIGNHISYFPLVIFFTLVLAGFNLPVSEDVLVVMSALLCQTEKASIPAFFIALYLGAVISDYMVYFWGRLIRKGTKRLNFARKILTEENTLRVSRTLEAHGFLTYLFGRFIPFGIRNVLCMTSGFVKYPFLKFLAFDSIAALCNISVLFWLVYFFGKAGSKTLNIFCISLFIIAALSAIYFVKSGKIFEFADKQIEKERARNAEKSNTSNDT